MDEAWCYETLRRLRWRHGLRCVQCGSQRVTVHTRSRPTPQLRYLCMACRRTFNDLSGTVFARSNLGLSTWFAGLSLLPRQLSTGEYAKAVSVKWDTARRMSRSLLVASARPGLVRDLLAAVLEREAARASR